MRLQDQAQEIFPNGRQMVKKKKKLEDRKYANMAMKRTRLSTLHPVTRTLTVTLLPDNYEKSEVNMKETYAFGGAC